MIASQMTHFLSPSRLSNSILDTFITSISKSLVLAFIWILLLSFIFMFFVYILGAVVKKTSAGSNWDEITTSGVYYVSNGSSATGSPSGAYQWGTLVVMSSVSGGGIMGVVQMYFENDSAGGRVWQRNRWQTINGFRPWVELTTNMPTFYKDYQDLNSLGTSLLSAFGYEKKQLLNQGDSVSFNRGYGFLFVTSIAIGQTYCFIVNAATPTPLAENASDYSAMLTFTKSSEQAFTITAAQRVNGTVIFIHG